MIYDCITFYNELDLLEVRLHELCDVVDRFVLVEATQTFQGNPKPLFFEVHKHAFSRYADKITHIVVEFPDEAALRSHLSTRPPNMTWAREHYQRDQISRGLTKALPDDLIIVSDVDEIISAAKLRGAIAERILGLYGRAAPSNDEDGRRKPFREFRCQSILYEVPKLHAPWDLEQHLRRTG